MIQVSQIKKQRDEMWLCQISEQVIRNIFQAHIQSRQHNTTSSEMVSSATEPQSLLEVLHIGIAAYHCQVQEILAEQGKFFDMKTWLQKQVLPHLHSMVPNDQAIETSGENHFPSSIAFRDMCWNGCFHCWTLKRRTRSQLPRFLPFFFWEKTSTVG